MYYGHSTVAIDAKGRTNLPRELRRELPSEAEGKVVVAPGPNGTLLLLDAPAFDRMMMVLQRMERTPEVAQRMRMFTALSAASVLDDQNRLTIPQRLIERAGLEGKITFVGEGDRITLMRPERFEAEMAASLDNADFDVFLDTLQIPASGPNA